MEKKIKAGITIGDYNGIGPEVIVKLMDDDRIFKFCDIVIYGQKQILNFYSKQLKIQNFQIFEVKDTQKLNPKIGNVINCFEDQIKVEPGVETADAGKKAMICIDKALEDLQNGAIDFLITGPVNKFSVSQTFPDFKGQTEYIAEKTGATNSLMMLVDGDLRVALVTNHISVKEVAGKIDAALISQKIEMLYHSLQKDFMIHKPKIAVLGLNPHNGDNGLMGKEEKDIILPVVQRLREKGMIIMGPFAADGFFGSGSYISYDGVLAMYHDQGLAPFKTISFQRGTNFTAGLKIIRTSPDHGPAYDIAGKGKASCDSLRSALFTGLDAFKNRAEYAEMTANPVERVKLNEEREA